MSIVCIHIIDNINTVDPVMIPKFMVKQICDLITSNMKYENQNGCYSNKDIKQLTNSKTPSLIQKRVSRGITVYLTDKNNRLVGCGMVQYKETHYEAKTLHIHHDFRGRGYARLICNIREDILRNHGIRFLLTESLKFPKTLNFHQSRGFYPYIDGKTRRFTQLMRKEL